MFCPTCGKDNSAELKFCASCGTNLEAVARALTGREEDFFTKMDSGMDYLIARYSEHVFRNAPQTQNERKVSGSWKLMGQAAVTSFVDIILVSLMWNLLPLRFLILIISSPFRLMAERSRNERNEPKLATGYVPPQLEQPEARMWRDELPPSVTEGTTTLLETHTSPRSAPTTDQLK